MRFPRGASLWISGSLAVATFACRPDHAEQPPPSGGTCPPSWLEAPVVDPSIAAPTGEHAVFHAAASGTQNYVCAAVPGDGGTTYAWKPTGPEATLNDCHGARVGRHVASDAGAAAPEWALEGGESVVAHKTAAWSAGAPTGADAGDGAVPWLLLHVDSHGGSGSIAEARDIERVRTNGGAAPQAGCDAAHAGTPQKVPYTADYYFFGP